MSSGAISHVSLILMQDEVESILRVASCQALAAASASSLFFNSSGERNSSFFIGSFKNENLKNDKNGLDARFS